MNKVENPCVRDCPNRNAECHGKCEKYLAFVKYRKRVLAIEYKRKSVIYGEEWRKKR